MQYLCVGMCTSYPHAPCARDGEREDRLTRAQIPSLISLHSEPGGRECISKQLFPGWLSVIHRHSEQLCKDVSETAKFCFHLSQSPSCCLSWWWNRWVPFTLIDWIKCSLENFGQALSSAFGYSLPLSCVMCTAPSIQSSFLSMAINNCYLSVKSQLKSPICQIVAGLLFKSHLNYAHCNRCKNGQFSDN